MINKIEEVMEYINKIFNELGKEKIEYYDGNYNYGIVDLGCPHDKPDSLPKGYCAVYIFIYEEKILKIGKVNEKSNARFCHHHYGFSTRSTLAKSICSDPDFYNKGINKENVKEWMYNNLQRINILIKSNKAAISLIESMLHYIFRPKYEGNI